MKENGKEKEKELSYKILAEIYNEENELELFVVENKHGKIMQVKPMILKDWS